MTRKVARILLVVALAVALFWIVPVEKIRGQANALPSTRNGEWPMYTADLRGSKYSPLDQINASNFSKLQVAWTFKTDGLSPTPEAKLEGTPIMIKGTIYATAGTSRSVVALDGKTGQLKWVYSMDEGERATRWAPLVVSDTSARTRVSALWISRPRVVRCLASAVV